MVERAADEMYSTFISSSPLKIFFKIGKVGAKYWPSYLICTPDGPLLAIFKASRCALFSDE